MRFSILCIFVILSVIRAEYPANWPKCKNSDETCLAKAIQEVMHKYASGSREANLLPVDPLRVKSMVLERNPSSSVNMNFILTNSDIFGLKAIQIVSARGYNADMSGRTVIEATIPELVIKGHYNIDGHILILPIVGDGPVEVRVKNVHLHYSFDLKPIEKLGQIYASLEHVKLDLVPEDGFLQFGNLFNGNKELAEHTNKFLNDNWRDIYGEIKPSVTKAIGRIVKSLMNSFLEKNPYSELFL